MGKPAALSDSIGFVVELVWPECIKVSEQTLLQQFGVQPRDTVDREAADDRQVRHPNMWMLTVFNQRHPLCSGWIIWKVFCNLDQEA